MRRALIPTTAIILLGSLSLSVPAAAVSTPTTLPTVSHPAPSPTSAAAKLLALADRDAQAQKWVRVTSTVNEAGIAVTTSTATVGADTASGTVTTSGILGSGTYSVLDLVKTNQYFIKGSASALGSIDHFAFTTEVAPSYAGKWVKINPSVTTEGATRFSANTIKEEFSTLTLTTPGKITAAHYNGRSVYAIVEDAYGIDETIYIPKATKPLPLAYTVTASGISDKVTWSNWGLGQAPVAPTSAVAYPKPAPTIPTTTSTSTSASAFCPDIATLNTDYTAFVVAGSATATTEATYVAQLNTLATDLSGLVTDLQSVIAAAPTPDLTTDYTVLLGYAQALTTTLSLINTSVATLPAAATMNTLSTAITPFEFRAVLDAEVIQYNKPTNQAAALFCPAATTLTTN